MTITTTEDVKELLKFLSSSLSLSKRIQDQCKEATLILAPDQRKTTTIPAAVVTATPVTGKAAFGISVITVITDAHKTLDALSVVHPLGKINIRKVGYHDYRIFYEILNIPKSYYKPWLYCYKTFVDDRDVIQWLTAQIMEVELLYMTVGGPSVVYRHR